MLSIRPVAAFGRLACLCALSLALVLPGNAAAQTVSNTATVAPPAGVTDPTPGNNTATDTDQLLKPVTITKTVTGAPAAGAPGNYVFTLTCGSPTATYNGTITLAGTATTGTTTVNVPAGSTGCTLNETARPNAPTGYTWGTATYTQPPTPIPSAGTVTAAIVNPLLVGIDAVDDATYTVASSGGTDTTSVATNDTVAGAQAVLGTNAAITASSVGTPPAAGSISLNATTGLVTVAANTSPGTYTHRV